MKLRKSTKGFTLIEIIIAIAIIALLILSVIWTLRNKIDRANDAKRKSDLQRIAIALEDYYSDEECYPIDTILSNCGGDALKPWGLASIPCDPVYKTPYCYLPAEPNTSECYQKYRLLNTLKYLSDPAIKSLGCDSGEYCGWETECSGSGSGISGFNYGVSSLNTTLLNPNITINPTPSPTPPPGLPPPGSIGKWGCTIQGDTCNVYGPGSPFCPITFSDFNICIQYCAYPQYRCTK
jgi:prepilin-type N-terminal cleavage/methylation domain-containing protein